MFRNEAESDAKALARVTAMDLEKLGLALEMPDGRLRFRFNGRSELDGSMRYNMETAIYYEGATQAEEFVEIMLRRLGTDESGDFDPQRVRTALAVTVATLKDAKARAQGEIEKKLKDENLKPEQKAVLSKQLKQLTALPSLEGAYPDLREFLSKFIVAYHSGYSAVPLLRYRELPHVEGLEVLYEFGDVSAKLKDVSAELARVAPASFWKAIEYVGRKKADAKPPPPAEGLKPAAPPPPPQTPPAEGGKKPETGKPPAKPAPQAP